MKPLNSYSNHDQNWQWPEKTWFRERLNAVKARENEERRKPATSPAANQKHVSAPADADKTGLKVG